MAGAAQGAFEPGTAGWIAESVEEPFVAMIGPTWIRQSEGRTCYGFVAAPRHCNRYGIVHGGMLLAFLDHAASLTAWESNLRNPQATIQFDTHFIDVVRPDDFVEAQCTIVSKTKSLIFTHATLLVGGRIVASAAGVYKRLGNTVASTLAVVGSDSSRGES